MSVTVGADSALKPHCGLAVGGSKLLPPNGDCLGRRLIRPGFPLSAQDGMKSPEIGWGKERVWLPSRCGTHL